MHAHRCSGTGPGTGLPAQVSIASVHIPQRADLRAPGLVSTPAPRHPQMLACPAKLGSRTRFSFPKHEETSGARSRGVLLPARHAVPLLSAESPPRGPLGPRVWLICHQPIPTAAWVPQIRTHGPGTKELGPGQGAGAELPVRSQAPPSPTPRGSQLCRHRASEHMGPSRAPAAHFCLHLPSAQNQKHIAY